jgi:hypothetical protein
MPPSRALERQIRQDEITAEVVELASGAEAREVSGGMPGEGRLHDWTGR